MRWRDDPWEATESLVALRRFSDLSRRMVPGLARRAGLTHSEAGVLETLVEHPLGPTQIAQQLGVSTAAASGIVDRLVERTHARREPHPDDGRRTVVTITPSGRAELLAHLAPMFRALAELDADFDDAERAVVARYLDGASAALRHLL